MTRHHRRRPGSAAVLTRWSLLRLSVMIFEYLSLYTDGWMLYRLTKDTNSASLRVICVTKQQTGVSNLLPVNNTSCVSEWQQDTCVQVMYRQRFYRLYLQDHLNSWAQSPASHTVCEGSGPSRCQVVRYIIYFSEAQPDHNKPSCIFTLSAQSH